MFYNQTLKQITFMATAYKLPEISISVKIKRTKSTETFSIGCSTDVAKFARTCFDEGKIQWCEEMVLICLNRANDVVGYYKVSSGGIAGTYCDPKVVFTVALNCCASSIILAHNHPSGNLKPSQADKDLTQKIKNAGKVLDIQLLDHLIITDESHYSFADYGIL